MIPLLPTLQIRPFAADDIEPLVELVNQQLHHSLYSQPFRAETLLAEFAQPTTLFPVRWKEHARLMAWRAGQLVGFIDAAAGFDEEHLDQPDHQPQGLIRSMALTTRSELIPEVAHALLQAAEEFWRAQKVLRVVAFHRSTGYRTVQAGIGILSSDWGEVVRVMTAHDYRFDHRYYLLSRELGLMLEEETPLANLNLAHQRLMHQGNFSGNKESIYQVYFRRVESVARARVLAAPVAPDQPRRAAHLLHFAVEELWRNHSIGRWLLRRIINDCTLAGYDELIVFPSSRQSIGLILLGQQSFVEQNYRGYTLEKVLS